MSDKTITAQAIVLGAGPAGISCALELHENKIDVRLIDQHSRLAHEVAAIPNRIRNLAGKVWPNGAALRESLEEQVRVLELRPMEVDTIRSVDLPAKALHANNAVYKAQAILLATGVRLRRIDIPGLAEVEGNVIYWVEPNEERLRGSVVAVIGGGDNALMDANWLADRCPQVFVIHRSALKARPDVVAAAREHAHIRLLADSRVDSIERATDNSIALNVISEAKGERTQIHVDFLVVKAGFAPNSELFKDQIQMSARGHIIVDQDCATSLPGIFAGGDVVHPESLGIARAVGHGMIAARAMARFIEGRH